VNNGQQLVVALAKGLYQCWRAICKRRST